MLVIAPASSTSQCTGVAAPWTNSPFMTQPKSATITNYRHDAQMDLRCKTPIQTHFFAAKFVARAELRAIREIETYRVFDLVDKFAGEKCVGHMGLLDFDLRGTVRIKVGPHHRLDQMRLCPLDRILI